MALAENKLQIKTDFTWVFNLATTLQQAQEKEFKGKDPLTGITYEAAMFRLGSYFIYLAKEYEGEYYFNRVAISDYEDVERVALFDIDRVVTKGGEFEIVFHGKNVDNQEAWLTVNRRDYRIDLTSPHF